MQKLVWQNANGNSVDLTKDPYGITEWEGFSNASLNIQNQQVPFQDGAVFLDALIEPRELSVTLKMQDKGNLEERYRMRRELIHILNPKLGEGYLIYTNDFISKRIKCVAQIPLFETHNSDTRGTPKASLAWTACEPYWEDLEETEVLFVDGDIINIENNGDIAIGVEMKGSFSNEIVNIKNETSRKAIILQGQEAGAYLINTKVGNKKICEIEKGFEYLLNNCVDFTIDDDLNIIIATNSGYIIKIEGFSYTSFFQSPAYIGKISFANGFYFIESDGAIYKTEDLKDYVKVINTDYLQTVIYGKGVYIARTSNRTYIYKSTNTTDWTTQDVGMTVRQVFYSAEKDLFVLIGDDGVIKTSPDATTWTLRTSGVSVNLFSITYSQNLGKFIVTGTGGVILTSSDAISWTQQTSGTEANIYSVACNDKYIIAVTSNGLIKSTDSVNWTLQNIHCTKIMFNDYFITLTAGGEIRYSRSGDNFSILNSQKGTVYLSNIRSLKKYGNKMFAYGQYFDDIRIFETEDDWQTWSLHTVNSYGQERIKYVYGEQKFVYIAGSKVSSSSDFENWDTYDFGETVNGIAYSEEQGQFVVSSNSHIFISTNATSWTSHNITGMRDIAYSEYYHKYFAISTTKIYESTDAINWNEIKTLDITYNSIEEKNGVIGLISSQKFLYKRPNENWEEQNYSNTESVSFCVINNVIYLLVYDKIYEIDSRKILIASNIIIYNYGMSLLNNNGVLYVSGYTYIGKEDKNGNEINEIDKLSTNSDIGFNLELGKNRILFSNIEGTMTLKFRQKYLGV